MSTRLILTFRSSTSLLARLPLRQSIKHSRSGQTGRRSLKIRSLNRSALAGLGQSLKRASTTSPIVGMAHEDPRNLERELEDVIKPWTGPSVFTTEPQPRLAKPGTRPGKPKGIPPRPQPQPRTRLPVGGNGGSSKSPINISSAESTPEPNSTRVRGVIRYESPGPRTAYTPPRPLPARSTSTSTTTGTSTNASIGADIRLNRGTNVHPFFIKGQPQFQRAGSVPTISSTVPLSQRPRYVAHYSSTDASTSQSESQSTQSQSTQSTFEGYSQPRPRDGYRAKGKGRDVQRGPRVGGPPEGWTDDAVDQLAEGLSATKISTSSDASRPRQQPLVDGISRSTVPPLRAPSSYNSTSTGSAFGLRRPNTTTYASNSNLPQKPKPNPKPKPKTKTKPPAPADEPDPNVSYFQYTSLTPTPKLAYTTDRDEADLLISCLKGNILGFDLEWPPAGLQSFKDPISGKVEKKWVGRSWDAGKGKYVFTTGKTALVQVCDGELIVLVHLKDMKELPQSMVDLIQDKSKYLLGVNINGDGRKLLTDFPTQLTRTTSLLELSRMARRIDGEAIGPGNTLIALAKLTERYLGKPLKKEGSVRRGNWAEALDAEQKEYAANDTYASYLIYQTLARLASERGIDLDLDEFSTNQGDVPDSLGAKMAPRASGSLSPTPAQERVIGLFIAGEEVGVIASSMGIKEGTVLGHLAGGIGRVDDDALSTSDKRRFLLAVGDDYWVGRTHGAVLARIRTDLAQDDAEAITQVQVE